MRRDSYHWQEEAFQNNTSVQSYVIDFLFCSFCLFSQNKPLFLKKSNLIVVLFTWRNFTKFTILSVQWFLANVLNCVTITAMQLLNISITPVRSLVPTYSQSLFSPTILRPRATTHLLSVSRDLSFPGISFKWNHAVCGLLHQASFTERNASGAHLCCST